MVFLGPGALIFPPPEHYPENADRRLDEGTARLVRSLRSEYPEDIIVVLARHR